MKSWIDQKHFTVRKGKQGPMQLLVLYLLLKLYGLKNVIVKRKKSLYYEGTLVMICLFQKVCRPLRGPHSLSVEAINVVKCIWAHLFMKPENILTLRDLIAGKGKFYSIHW